MFLASPALPISFQLEETVKLVEQILEEKNWHKFEVGSISLVLFPYFVFSYDAIVESSESEEENSRPESVSGTLALNGETLQLDDTIAESIDFSELVNALDEKYPIEARKAACSKQRAERLALLHTANYLNSDRKDVIISDLRLIYYPKWFVYVKVAEGSYELQVSAVNGEVIGEEEVPFRRKGFLEITSETLQELQQPDAWVKYTKDITLGTVKFVSNVSMWKRLANLIIHNRLVQAAIFLIALIAVLALI